ncbi:OLC1v1021129C1 [Oldenlandia corymbosa var. corymbosa]|uniref:OLC1v1021129C1 n=1 Tax=Oldenlandia corymbosa var. corymbosa TaxID=529605 RepID=A0AAV1BX73_OLDCO|nr:OLC1v1021129C1 [Oldenlandia corymbosa var. corymbosa]
MFSRSFTLDLQVAISRQLKVHDGLDIKWSGQGWICAKQLKHYPAFCLDKTTISVCSFVLMTGKDEQTRYLAYLEDLYEDIKGEKMVRVRWFYHNEEVKNLIPELNDAQPNEVFITPHVQDRIHVKCVDNVATVLSPYHYEKCSAIFPKGLSSAIFICHREFKCNKKIIEPFPIGKLRGYESQELLRRNLLSFLLQQHGDDSIEQNKCPPSDCPAGVSNNQRTRSRRRKCTKPERFCLAAAMPNSLILENRIEESKEPLGPGSNQVDGAEPSGISYSMFDQENQHIEILSLDSGTRGCWFKCKILRASKKKIRVQYFDIEDADGAGKLEEWIPASRVAVPDKLGMRCAGRLTVRPCQPPHNTSDQSFEVGDAVDAWRGDGWWEGVVISFDNNSGSDDFEVYFPGENKFLTLQKNDLRPSRDWIDEKWVEVAAKGDILSVISSLRSSSAEASESGSLAAHPKKDVPIVHPKKRLRGNYSDQAGSKEPNSSLDVEPVAKDMSFSQRKLHMNKRNMIVVD